MRILEQNEVQLIHEDSCLPSILTQLILCIILIMVMAYYTFLNSSFFGVMWIMMLLGYVAYLLRYSNRILTTFNKKMQLVIVENVSMVQSKSIKFSIPEIEKMQITYGILPSFGSIRIHLLLRNGKRVPITISPVIMILDRIILRNHQKVSKSIAEFIGVPILSNVNVTTE